MTDIELEQAAHEARIHADNLRDDIPNATTRVEHMRLTRLAVEADHLANLIHALAARADVPQDMENEDGYPIGVDFPTHLS